MSRIVGLSVSFLSFSAFCCRIGALCSLSLSLSFLWIPGSGGSSTGLSPYTRSTVYLVPMQSTLLADYAG
jgi:hypothetical protein